jgi:hypothetical protein
MSTSSSSSLSSSSSTIMPNAIIINAHSTSCAKASALAFFEFFYKEFYAKDLIDLEEVECNEELFKVYAGYLVSMCVTYNRISRDTAKNYFGVLKGHVLKKFKSIKEVVESFCTAIVASIHREVTTDCSKKGLVASEQSRPIYRSLLKVFCLFFIRQNSKKGSQLRLLSITNFSAVGRSGESAFISWRRLYWSLDLQSPVFVYNDIKTAKQYPMTFFNDAVWWEIDFVDALGDYIIVHRGICESANFLFPDNAALKDPAHFMCQMLQEAANDINGADGMYPWKDVNPTGLRAGAVDTLIQANVHPDLCNVRGGWTVLTAQHVESNMKNYIGLTPVNTSFAGKALAGFLNYSKPLKVKSTKIII